MLSEVETSQGMIKENIYKKQEGEKDEKNKCNIKSDGDTNGINIFSSR